MFEMNLAIQGIVSIGLILYVGFSLSKTVKEFMAYRKNSKIYLEKFKGCKEEHYGIWQCILLGLITLSCFVMAVLAQYFSANPDELLLYRVAYLCIGIIFLGLTLEMWIHRSIIFSEDGFFLGTKAYRFRMITTLEKKKGIFKTIRILFHNGESIQVSLKVGELIRLHYKAYNAKKKEKKEQRRKR